MGRRRKGVREASKALNQTQEGNDENAREIAEEEGGEGKSRFFACYLLTSLCPRFKGHTYIGFTVNPRRRIRQHNGEIRSGAWRTKKRRPWEMVLCIYGFPTNVAALQFEWAWQYPVESLAVRKAATSFKSLSGIANKIKLAYTMLTLPAWQSMNLTVNFFSTKYQNHIAVCPNLPEHMRVQVCSMDELPCYTGNNQVVGGNDDWDDDEECEQSSGSEESTQNGLTEAQMGYSAGVQNNSEDTEFEKCNLIEELGTGHEQGAWRGEPGFKQLQNSCNREEDNWQSFQLNDSPGRVSSLSTFSGNDVTEDTKAGDISKLFNDCSVEYDQFPGQLSPTKVLVNKEQVPSIIPSAVEVIDLLTPSPCCTGNKKRKFCPEIIDLTNSPMFV